jgi:hypothetical protein
MDTTGTAREGWMTIIPVTVFLLIVVLALGGPEAFVNTVSVWVGDVAAAAVRWIKQL